MNIKDPSQIHLPSLLLVLFDLVFFMVQNFISQPGFAVRDYGKKNGRPPRSMRDGWPVLLGINEAAGPLNIQFYDYERVQTRVAPLALRHS